MINFLLRNLGRDLAYQISRRANVDKAEGKPILVEEALVHAKSEHSDCYIIHFYIAAKDDVVSCEVPYEIWRDLKMKSRGMLTHQGGGFYSFETQDAMYCEEALYDPEARY